MSWVKYRNPAEGRHLSSSVELSFY